MCRANFQSSLRDEFVRGAHAPRVLPTTPSSLGLVWDGFKHHRVHHHENEFARGKRHINGIESFWSFAKTRLAKQRGVRADKFPLHLKESEWHWNHRRDNLYASLLKTTRSHPLN